MGGQLCSPRSEVIAGGDPFTLACPSPGRVWSSAAQLEPEEGTPCSRSPEGERGSPAGHCLPST